MQAFSEFLIPCEWQGSIPASVRGSKIEMKPQGQRCTYSVTVPQMPSSEQFRALQISYKKYNKQGEVSQEGRFDFLHLLIERIQNLTICMELSKEIKLQLPPQLDRHQNYCLILSFDEKLCANLISKSSVFQDETVIWEIFNGKLLREIMSGLVNFNFQTSQKYPHVSIKPVEGAIFEKKACIDEIMNIDKRVLKNLIIKIAELQQKYTDQSELMYLSDQIFEVFKEAITAEGFFNIMDSVLRSRLARPIRPEIDQMIIEISEEFMNNCMGQI